MSASKHLKILSVRLPAPDIRRFKTLAASRGFSIQEAVHQALESWASETGKPPITSLLALEGSLTDIDVDGLRLQERALERTKEQALADD